MMQSMAVVLLSGSLLGSILVAPSCSSHEGEHAPGVLLAAPNATAANQPNAPSSAPPAAADTGFPAPQTTPKSVADPAASGAEKSPAPSAAGTAGRENPPTSTAGSAKAIDPAFEVALASEFVHRPAGVLAWLDEHAKEVASSRAGSWKSLALAVKGADVEARAEFAKLEIANGSGPESELVQQILAGDAPHARSAASGKSSLIADAARLALTERAGRKALEQGRLREAAECFSTLLLAEVRSPWRSEPSSLQDWSEALRRAQAGWQWSRRGEWLGIEVKVEPADSLIAIRKRVLKEHPELCLCTGLIARANELKGETIQPGQVLRLPTARPSMLVDLDARWAFYLLGDVVAAAWPVGVGKPGSETPPGDYTVGDKSNRPMWFPPGQAPVPFGDPKNPLGTRWIEWVSQGGTKLHLGFHGTRDPESIGQDESQGCVRMLNRHVEELYEILPVGAAIHVQP